MRQTTPSTIQPIPMRGKPIPTELKRLASSDGIHDSGGRVIQPCPQPVQGSPDIPEELTGDALLAWHSFIYDMQGMNVVTKADRASMIMLCQSWAVMQDASRHIAKEGNIIKLSNGVMATNPYLKLWKEHFPIVSKLLGEFGLTPVSRSKIIVNPIEDDDELMELR